MSFPSPDHLQAKEEKNSKNVDIKCVIYIYISIILMM